MSGAENPDEFELGEFHIKTPGDEPGECQCGAELPPMREWRRAGSDWANVVCTACGFMFVDEESYFAVCPPATGEMIPCPNHDPIDGPHHQPDCHYYDDEPGYDETTSYPKGSD